MNKTGNRDMVYERAETGLLMDKGNLNDMIGGYHEADNQ